MPADRAGETEKPDAGAEGAELPELDFSTFVISLAHSALINLGLAQDPSTGERVERNLGAARQTIDILGILQDKTRGNLETEEAQHLEHILYELRMHYVACSKQHPEE